jgi:hypothetical protein
MYLYALVIGHHSGTTQAGAARTEDPPHKPTRSADIAGKLFRVTSKDLEPNFLVCWAADLQVKAPQSGRPCRGVSTVTKPV